MHCKVYIIRSDQVINNTSAIKLDKKNLFGMVIVLDLFSSIKIVVFLNNKNKIMTFDVLIFPV